MIGVNEIEENLQFQRYLSTVNPVWSRWLV